MSSQAWNAVAKAAERVPYGLKRSVFIRVHPQPESLSERRAVLRLLQRHGEVEMFKKLRSNNNSFISVMKSSDAAKDVASRSPITYELITDKFAPPGARDVLEITSAVEPIETTTAADSSLASNYMRQVYSDLNNSSKGRTVDPGRPTGGSSSSGGGGEGHGRAKVEHKSFTLHAFTTERYDHGLAIRVGPLWGRWPEEPVAREMLMFKALRESVPSNPGHEGLCDWYTGGQLTEGETATTVAKPQRQVARFKNEAEATFVHASLGLGT
ncbi:hypothetical protein RB595_002990 [Gaeumannomyces hyphopodioides]